jgi:alkylation response protein AidB-like acyl-CoA dehydrogenase
MSVLNGSRIFISNAALAGVIIVFAVTDKSRGTEGISAFIVRAGAPGLQIGRHLKKVGIRGSIMAEAALENCRIPKENLLGGEGQGGEIARMTPDGSRMVHCCAGRWYCSGCT